MADAVRELTSVGILDRLAHHVRRLLPCIIIASMPSARNMPHNVQYLSPGAQLLDNAVHGLGEGQGLLRHGRVDFTSVGKQLERACVRLP